MPNRCCRSPIPGLTVKDLEKLQVQHPDYRMELVGGEIVVMSPSGYESDTSSALRIDH